MTLKDVTKWNRIVSTVYAMGVWTMIGSFAYFHYTGRFKNSTDSAQNEEERTEKPKDRNEVLHQTAHTKTIILYKKDFVPYTTRIYNFFQSFTGGPSTGDS
ncbi:small integral membrane protein 26-like [Phyllopteryx taeniolatus]|uniref:small integral membrane protein 26-like n=1 Tax=Phyllopteryx taeniolatus TaxID=161469 RepID=UPI002AD388B5|nr:small integral membrane protein 26-like [Phyllopteryx taeniolatus]